MNIAQMEFKGVNLHFAIKEDPL